MPISHSRPIFTFAVFALIAVVFAFQVWAQRALFADGAYQLLNLLEVENAHLAQNGTHAGFFDKGAGYQCLLDAHLRLFFQRAAGRDRVECGCYSSSVSYKHFFNMRVICAVVVLGIGVVGVAP